MAPKKNAFAKASEVLTDAFEEIQEILHAPEHNGVLIQTQAAIESIKRRLDHLAGYSTTSVMPVNEHPPITNFMGDEIGESKLVDIADLTPGNDDKEIFRTRVETLYRQFDTISPDGILNAHTTAEDQLVLRGVAKRAGLDDFKDAPLNYDFVERINSSIKKQAEAVVQKNKEAAETEIQERNTNLRSELKSHQVEGARIAEQIETAEKDLASASALKKPKIEAKLAELRTAQGQNKELQNATEQLLKDAPTGDTVNAPANVNDPVQ
jgi:hypothetical protein